MNEKVSKLAPGTAAAASGAISGSQVPAEVRGLTKIYGAVTAVDRISFTLKKGTTVALLGGNGAGKTTTIAMLLGLVVPSSGRVTVFGDVGDAFGGVGDAVKSGIDGEVLLDREPPRKIDIGALKVQPMSDRAAIAAHILAEHRNLARTRHD